MGLGPLSGARAFGEGLDRGGAPGGPWRRPGAPRRIRATTPSSLTALLSTVRTARRRRCPTAGRPRTRVAPLRAACLQADAPRARARPLTTSAARGAESRPRHRLPAGAMPSNRRPLSPPPYTASREASAGALGRDDSVSGRRTRRRDWPPASTCPRRLARAAHRPSLGRARAPLTGASRRA